MGSPLSSSRHTPRSSKDKSRRFFRPRPLSLVPDPAVLSFISHPIHHSPPESPPPFLPKKTKALALLTSALPRQNHSFEFPAAVLKTDSTLFVSGSLFLRPTHLIEPLDRCCERCNCPPDYHAFSFTEGIRGAGTFPPKIQFDSHLFQSSIARNYYGEGDINVDWVHV